jgi:ABC-type lipoprotein release transport system permease subunit
LTVSGVLDSTGSQDDQILFTRLDTAQSLLGKQGRVSMAEVAALCAGCPVEEMVRQISEVIPGANVMAIKQVVQGRMETLEHFRKAAYALSAVVALVGALVVLVTMMGSVRERTSEIGIFRAIGYRKSHVMKIILLEAGIISVLAGILGYLLGLGATKVALPFFSGGHGVAVPLDPVLAGGAFALAMILGLAASVYPALLADEPTGNLDTKTTREIRELLRTLNSGGMTILMVTHNPECAQYARRILRLSDGLLVEEEETQKGGEGYPARGDQKGIPFPEAAAFSRI